jgi:hypothetical protein
MKLSIRYRNTSWGDFEKDYENDNPENDLACLFEYVYQHQFELWKKWNLETNTVKRDMILAKMNHIRKILERYKEFSEFLMLEANAL